MSKGSATRMVMLCLLLLAAALSPAAGGTQVQTTIEMTVPNGSYFTTCDRCVYTSRNDTYSCQCQNRQQSYVSTSVVLSTCTMADDGFYYLSNEDGKLTCATS